MSRTAHRGRRARIWMIGVGVLALLAAGAGTAVAGSDRSADRSATAAHPVAETTTAKADKAPKSPQPGRKPRPTASPTSSPTASPTPTTTSPPSTDVNVQIRIPGYVTGFRFGDILADEARGRVYLTGGKGTDGLIVTDLDGKVLRTLPGIAPGAAGMTLSPDGRKLYIAAGDQDWLRIVDLDTWELDGQFTGKTDGTMTCPKDMAFAAGQLWVSWGCENEPTAGIGRVDLATGKFYVNAVDAIDERISSAMLLATSPAQPDMLIAGATGTSPALLVRFEATPTGLVQRAISRTDGGSVAQLAVTPDGTKVIVPSGAPYYHPVLRTSDLVEVHRYPAVPYPDAVAIRPDGLVVAGTDSSYDEDVRVFEPGGTTPIATYEFGHLPNQETWAHNLVTGGLAVSGNRIYAVTDQLAEPEMVTLRIRDLP
ncbi:WD40 repeat domain-containing protein [Micromonospora sp. NPDC005806]|uniref:WD40 repeat domain-containing protein n=1 Tax=Micromonospora sp. NPDC005806 TaxID=3364234 RepID=UPI0036C3CD02